MTKVNRVITFPEPRRIEIVERPYPRIKPGFALVKQIITPMCMEYQIYDDFSFEPGADAFNQGHEGVGEVIEVAESSRFKVGDRVMIWDGQMCGECWPCMNFVSVTHCEKRGYISEEGMWLGVEKDCESESGGFGFSEYRIAPEYMTMKIPDELSYKHAAAAGCLCGCTYTAVEVLGVKAGDWVLVGGIGFVGMGVIINAKYRGAKVIALGRNEFRMDISRQLGADYVLNPDDPEWYDKVLELTGYLRGVDNAFECSGYPYYQSRCLQALRQYGKIFLLGHVPESDERWPIHAKNEIINKHVTMTGGHDVYITHRPGLMAMLCDKDVQRKVDIAVTHEFPWSRLKDAFETALTKKCGKIYLNPFE